MRFGPTSFGQVLEGLDRRSLAASIARHDGDAYDKCFGSWDHLLALIFAQLGPVDSLRGLELAWNAHAAEHAHLASGPLHRSTLADANQRRPLAVFAEVAAQLAGQLDRRLRRDGLAMLRLIDASPIPLGAGHAWAGSNGRIRGLKLHLVFTPLTQRPRLLDITPANRNDAEIGRRLALEAGATYVFDKGYCHYAWWTAIQEAGAVFVTRPKANMRLAARTRRSLPHGVAREGEDFTLLSDTEVRLASKGDSRLTIPLRRIRLRRHAAGGKGPGCKGCGRQGTSLTLLTNDTTRTAIEIATLYKARWQIELLFRWLKQHLKIRRFLGRSEHAVKLQLLAALIAFALLRLAARRHGPSLPVLRWVDLLRQGLFERRSLDAFQHLVPRKAAKARLRAEPPPKPRPP